MSEAKFTPGPWIARIGNGIEVCGPDAVAIAEIWVRGNKELETANAHLIAAAPELFDCLQRCLEEMAWIGPKAKKTAEDSRAALDKARGEA